MMLGLRAVEEFEDEDDWASSGGGDWEMGCGCGGRSCMMR